MACNTLAVLPMFLLGALAVFVRDDLGFGEFELGLAVAAFALTSALASVPGGRWSEWLGTARAMRVAATGSAACLLGVALLAREWTHLLVLLIVGGLANGIAAPATNGAVSRLVPEHRQGLAFGAKQAAIPTAILLGGAAVPLLALTVGWRWAFAAAATGAVAVWVLVQPVGGRPLRERGAPVRAGDTAARVLVLLALAAGVGGMGVNAMGVFYVESAAASGLPAGVAGALFAAGGVTGIASRVLWGWQADRRGHRHLPVVAALMGTGSAGVALLALAPAAWALLLGTLLAFGAGWGWPGLFNYAVVRHNRNAPSAATGITQAGVFVGACVGPPVFGAIVEAAGYPTAWLAAAATLLAATAPLLAARHLLIRDLTRGRR